MEVLMPFHVLPFHHESVWTLPEMETKSLSKKPAPERKHSKPFSWTFVEGFIWSVPTRRLILNFAIGDSAYILVIVEESSGANEQDTKRTDDAFIDSWQHNGASASICQNTAHEILSMCKQQYSTNSPPFGDTIYYTNISGHPKLHSQFDPHLLSVLLPRSQTFTHPLPTALPLIPRHSLPIRYHHGHRLPPQTRIVTHNGTLCFAKMPLYSSRALQDLSEISNLLYLPCRHPNIIPPPAALITTFEYPGDDRICGFLLPYYPNGNLSNYANTLRATGNLTEAHLLKWVKQLISAVQFLAEAGTWHGDIKPDNILVDDQENIILIDFARLFTMFVTVSPEVRRLCSAPGSKCVGIPSHWPLSKVVPSEAYSIGRTMYFGLRGRRYGRYLRGVWLDDQRRFPSLVFIFDGE